MQTKYEYIQNISLKKELQKVVKQDPFRLGFHIMPPTGWLNDPNGLCQFHGLNHIYFQYTPFTPTWGMKLWGHYTTDNWVDYQEREPFIFADHPSDRDGVYSGSAFIFQDKIHYFYTGNVKYEGNDYDYIRNGREQNTIEIISKDGFTYEHKQCILTNLDYPSDCSCHVRDPKIYEKKGAFYMVLGARTNSDKGCVLLFKSNDLKEWTYHMRIESQQEFGYMWECPDLFDLEDKTILMCCPQGIPQQGIQYANVYQFGYFEIQLDLDNKTYVLSQFKELDRGFDIYASQSFLDEQQRRIYMAWMGIPDATYHNQPTVDKGWQHALTLPKELKIRSNQIVQVPLKEFEKLRKNLTTFQYQNKGTFTLFPMCEFIFDFKHCQGLKLTMKQGIHLTYAQHVLTLSFDECGCGRDQRSVKLDQLTQLHIFLDTSSIEIFVNEGSEVFTSRHYAKKQENLRMEGNFEMDGCLYELDPFKIQELEEVYEHILS